MESTATEKQVLFIKSLLNQKEMTPEIKAHVEALVAVDTMTKAEASKRIEWLLALPNLPKEKVTYVDPPEGMHVKDGDTYKVYKTRNGHTVASKLVRDSTGAWGFEYLGKRGLSGLGESTRMPAEEAKSFGKTYGICVRCAKHLTDERSVFAGYGEWCANAEGWVYPKMSEAMEGLGFTTEAPLAEAPGSVSLEDLLLGDLL